MKPFPLDKESSRAGTTEQQSKGGEGYCCCCCCYIMGPGCVPVVIFWCLGLGSLKYGFVSEFQYL